MGACNIELVFDGDLLTNQVKEKVRDQRESDRIQYGTDGYNGSWSTIPDVRFPTNDIFDDYAAAEDYCLDKAQKWEYAVAVRYHEGDKTMWLISGWACI